MIYIYTGYEQLNQMIKSELLAQNKEANILSNANSIYEVTEGFLIFSSFLFTGENEKKEMDQFLEKLQRTHVEYICITPQQEWIREWDEERTSKHFNP
ncbi:hypothetical protein [Caldalkalibacillus mannanilyticus]|uniref:hypothetical protein n=1 Tax=Caldalkalibacillus mannanilyticus TaxID=1418 RepID=UPI00046A1B27|nr:hypothetical protein [Caldalkalibacillus mannanilyticus]